MDESYHTQQPPHPKRERQHSRRKPIADIYTKEGFKMCPACDQELPLDEYTVRKDGRSTGTCKECVRARDRERNKLRRPRKTPIIPEATKEGFKVCHTCLTEKEYAAFKHDYQKKDTYASHCKQCYRDQWDALPEEEKEQERKRDRESRLPRIEGRRAYDRQRHNTDKHREARRDRNAIRKMTEPHYLDELRSANTQWRKRNPLHAREYSRWYKTRQRAARRGHVNYKNVLERDGHFCYICERDILPHQDMAFDHKIPLHPRLGEPQGTHTEDNIHPTHDVCNLRKSNKQFAALTHWDRRGV